MSLGKPHVVVACPSSSCHLFFESDIQDALWEMNICRVADEEAFHVEFFKHGIHLLIDYIVDLFNLIVCLRFA